MTHAPLATVRRILRPFRGGSSWPVLVEADGHRCVMKWSGGAEGPLANAADMISLRLARLVGIAVPTPRLLQLTDNVADPRHDPELNDLIHRSVGTNLGIDEVPSFEPYEPRHRELIPPEQRSSVYALDLLLLNMDRVAGNPNMVMTPEGLLCWDYAAAMELRMLLNGRSIDEKRFFPLLRQHPFFEPGEPPKISWPTLDRPLMDEILADLPPEWLPSGVDRRAISDRLSGMFANAVPTIARRHAGSAAAVVETDTERKSRTDANRRAFEETVQRLANRPGSGRS